MRSFHLFKIGDQFIHIINVKLVGLNFVDYIGFIAHDIAHYIFKIHRG